MNRAYIALFVAVLAVVAGVFWYTRTPNTPESSIGGASEEPMLGTYTYTCDDDVAFLVTLSSDMSSLRIEPVIGMTYPEISVLADSPTDTGRRFRSADYEFHGKGEAVTLYDVQTQVMRSCIPQSKPDEAPLNFGD